MTLPVITAADGASWEADLLGRLTMSTSLVTVVRRCVDVVELAAVAASAQAVAALVDARLRRLDAEVVERIAACGVAVIGVTGGEADLDRLRESGISFAVPAEADPAVFAEVIQSAVAALGGTGEFDRSFADPATGTGPLLPAGIRSVVQPDSVDGPDGQPVSVAGTGGDRERGKVIAVWGPTGAPGRTMLAANLAEEMARLDRDCLLVDADVYGGVIANMLGLLDESPGVVAACRQAQSNRLDLAALASLCWQLGPKLRVLTGITRADRWLEMRPAALERVLDLARELAGFTVLDLGFSLESDEELSFDTVAPRRNGATLAALAAADVILVVGAADPVGMQRLIRGLDELRSAEFAAPIWVVLNKVRAASVPGNPEAELTAALQRFAGRAASAMLPFDLDALDRALVAGKSLAEVAPQSALRKAVAELAAALVGQPAPGRGRRRRHST